MKNCKICKQLKLITEFNKAASSKDGLRTHCKTCEKSLQKNYYLKSKKIRSLYKKEYYKRNKNLYIERQKTYKNQNKEKVAIGQKKRYQNNKNNILKKRKLWREQNPQKARERDNKYRDQQRSYSRIYRKLNIHKLNALSAKRRAIKILATPRWLTKVHFQQIEIFYEAAKDQSFYGLKCHVDHIIPFNGRIVSGLHVPWNLQILTAAENIGKSNKFA